MTLGSCSSVTHLKVDVEEYGQSDEELYVWLFLVIFFSNYAGVDQHTEGFRASGVSPPQSDSSFPRALFRKHRQYRGC